MNPPCDECFMYYECPNVEKRKLGEDCDDFEVKE